MRISDPILTYLELLFREVVRAVKSGGADRRDEVGFNPKGDRVKWFDLAADRAVCDYLRDRSPWPVRLLSEEGAPREFGGGEPRFTVVLDPVDGSDNFARGIAPSGMAVALIPADLPISVDTVRFALVGDLLAGETWLAARGRGAYGGSGPIHTSSATRLEEAMISCDLNHFEMEASLAHVLSRARGVRAFGSATRALSMVATGSLDAHIDVRDRLTPENFLAPSLILTEAGGLITGPEGNPLPEIRSLTERYSILAAATRELHTALARLLKRGG